METYFAKPERADFNEFQFNLNVISRNPVIDTILKTTGGLLAVLNEHRQVLSINEAFLNMLGIKNSASLLGLRPGEVISCIHSHEEPGGCGTSRYCSSCGAAIAIVTCLSEDKIDERKCVATVTRNDKEQDLYLNIKAHPITVDEGRFILLFIQDITIDQQRASLERMFFHDISNIIQGLESTSELLNLPNIQEKDSLARHIQTMAARLSREIEIQRTLSLSEHEEYHLKIEEADVSYIFGEINDLTKNHPASRNKILTISAVEENFKFNTDISLLLRIITNMIINAFEATDQDGEVRLWLEKKEDKLIFNVWNEAYIPEETALRVFQRNFSTKNQCGRGLGTFSIKLFGEKCLRGKIEFETDIDKGTVFKYYHPINM